MSTKEWAGLFKFCLDLELYGKKLKRLGFCALFFYIFITKSRSRQVISEKKGMQAVVKMLVVVANLAKVLLKVINQSIQKHHQN